jgi:Spy/CpxP family protein refolding chaperone
MDLWRTGKMTRKIALLGAMMALLTTTVEAQERARADSAGVTPRAEGRRATSSVRRMPATRTRMDGSPARALIGQRERLQLTDEQVRRLEALAAQQRESLRPNEPAMLRARADLMEAMQRDNIEGARTAMERMSRLRTDASVARLQARKQARDVLTADQRTRVDEGRRMMTDRGMGRRPDRGMRGSGRRELRQGMRPRGSGLVGPRPGRAPRSAPSPRNRRF